MAGQDHTEFKGRGSQSPGLLGSEAPRPGTCLAPLIHPRILPTTVAITLGDGQVERLMLLISDQSLTFRILKQQFKSTRGKRGKGGKSKKIKGSIILRWM